MTMIEFLLARIAEDEAVARTLLRDLEMQIEAYGFVADKGGPFTPSRMLAAQLWAHYDGQTQWRNFARGQHIATLASPARVLAECEAKRRIVELHSSQQGMRYGYCEQCWDGNTPLPYPCLTLRILAQPYAEHPDYRVE